MLLKPASFLGAGRMAREFQAGESLCFGVFVSPSLPAVQCPGGQTFYNCLDSWTPTGSLRPDALSS